MTIATLRTRISAWWSAWQFVVYLAIALGLSLYGNWWQFKRALTADLRAENADLTKTVETVRKLASGAQADQDKLLADLAAIAERGKQQRIVYRQAAAAAPLADNCAPGQARMDAVNSGIPAKE
jgi:hypothetical protein